MTVVPAALPAVTRPFEPAAFDTAAAVVDDAHVTVPVRSCLD